MDYQASKPYIRTDVLQEMTFDNRLKPSFENAQMKKVLVAFDDKNPIGYVYAEVADVTEDLKYYVPEWANNIYRQGQYIFYLDEQDLPARLGTFNNIYIKPEYHGLNIGYQLSNKVMEWMKNIDGITGIYVYVSNGNEQVVDFYKKFGFQSSHNVLGGFITAYYQKIQRSTPKHL
ncbi:GNAT family N-acetyltransferase [Maribellus maritimus]|uniref:GNAT family N-acetyltransferase n=1 Tax=Maribellus maritimus TaxID=2870838 RepID=UPI001EEA2677|nr:GNAT family N-acetyltransferase [Maribellus maritimus]MCG6191294.1 GNAT family N-acetyltransferase [Maribellus maritimus]